MRAMRNRQETRDAGRPRRQRQWGIVVGTVGEAEVIALANVARTARVRCVPFGFPSAMASSGASDDADAATTDGAGRTPIKLGDVVGRQPATTFFIKMATDALLDSGIYSGDVLVVDRTLRPHYGALAVVTLSDRDEREGRADAPDPLDGPMLVRHYCPDRAAVHLLPAHPDFAPMSVAVIGNGRTHQRARMHVWGVVVGIVAGGRWASR